jgi:uncharacterized protein YqeY
MSLLEQIREDFQRSLKEKDFVSMSVYRLLLAEIHNKEIEKQRELTDEDVAGVVKKQIKMRAEAIEAYKNASNEKLASKEKSELEILSKYVPQQISDVELEKAVTEVIKETGASSPVDFGKVMGAVMGKVKGQADGATVAKIVKQALTNDVK